MDGARGAAVLVEQVDRRALRHDHADLVGVRVVEILVHVAKDEEDAALRVRQQVQQRQPPDAVDVLRLVDHDGVIPMLRHGRGRVGERLRQLHVEVVGVRVALADGQARPGGQLLRQAVEGEDVHVVEEADAGAQVLRQRPVEAGEQDAVAGLRHAAGLLGGEERLAGSGDPQDQRAPLRPQVVQDVELLLAEANDLALVLRQLELEGRGDLESRGPAGCAGL